MTAPADLLVLAASNGENLKLAERFATAGRERGLTVEVLDLTTINMPLYNPRTHAEAGIPEAVIHLSHQLEKASHWVICAPEYNGSIPPVLTSAIAWLSVQGGDFRGLFNERPIAIATHSGGGGHSVLTALRLQLAYLGAQVVGRQLVSNRAKPAKAGSIADLLARLHTMAPINM